MESYLTFYKNVNTFLKMGHNGYQLCLEYVGKYSLAELEYYEIEAEYDLEALEVDSKSINVAPLLISLFSLFMSAYLSFVEKDFGAITMAFVCILAIVIITGTLYIYNYKVTSKLFAKKKRTIRIIHKVIEKKKEEKELDMEQVQENEVTYVVTIRKK